MSQKNEPHILIDSDVVRHFISGHRLHQLSSIFPNRFVMLDKVKQELCRSKNVETTVCNFLNHFKIPVIPLPKDPVILKEYAHLLKAFSEGESACMALARYQQKYIASSNLKDIRIYCEEHRIQYYTTMDLLVKAVELKIMTETDADLFIRDVKNAGGKLPCDTLQHYITVIRATKQNFY
jgi:hypothetical protein